MRLPFVVDGVNLTNYANKYEYSIDHGKREGPNSGTMMDGSKVEDVLKRPAIITWDLNDCDSTTLSMLLGHFLRDTVEVTYFETATNAERTATFIPTVSPSHIGILRAGKCWFKGTGVVLEEQ